MAVDLPSAALAACVGCGCVGGACYAPTESLPGPLADVKAAIVQVVGGFGFGSGNYSHGGQTWNQQRGWN